MDLKIEAEILRNCLEFELISKSEVIMWADKVIEQSDQPDLALIEVSMSQNCHINEVSKLLKEVKGTINQDLVYRGIFEAMQAKLQDDPKSETRIVRILFQMAMNEDVPDKLAESEMFWFYDALDLAARGYHGNVEEVRKKLHTFLNRYAGNLN